MLFKIAISNLKQHATQMLANLLHETVWYQVIFMRQMHQCSRSKMFSDVLLLDSEYKATVTHLTEAKNARFIGFVAVITIVSSLVIVCFLDIASLYNACRQCRR
jgi:hypothetical protein